jgi:hypothetical protein
MMTLRRTPRPWTTQTRRWMSPCRTTLQSRQFYRSSGRLRQARRNKAFSLTFRVN